jgi:hypothetical protein
MTTKHRAEVLTDELQRIEDSIVNHGLVHFCCVLADARIKLRTIPAMEAEIESLKEEVKKYEKHIAVGALIDLRDAKNER